MSKLQVGPLFKQRLVYRVQEFQWHLLPLMGV